MLEVANTYEVSFVWSEKFVYYLNTSHTLIFYFKLYALTLCCIISIFRRFLRYNLSWAPIVYRLVDAAIMGNYCYRGLTYICIVQCLHFIILLLIIYLFIILLFFYIITYLLYYYLFYYIITVLISYI